MELKHSLWRFPPEVSKLKLFYLDVSPSLSFAGTEFCSMQVATSHHSGWWEQNRGSDPTTWHNSEGEAEGLFAHCREPHCKTLPPSCYAIGSKSIAGTKNQHFWNMLCIRLSDEARIEGGKNLVIGKNNQKSNMSILPSSSVSFFETLGFFISESSGNSVLRYPSAIHYLMCQCLSQFLLWDNCVLIF